MSKCKIDKNGNKRWFNDEGKKLHRIDGPAVERANGDKFWYVNGLLHRLDGPAVELANGSVEYWEDGVQKFIRTIYDSFEVSCE